MKFTLAALVLCFALSVCAFEFYVEPGREKCFDEEFAFDVLVMGNYQAVEASANNINLNVWVQGPSNDVFYKSDSSLEDSFIFTTSTAGKYIVCFLLKSANGGTVPPPTKVKFNLKVGVETNDYSQLAAAEHLTPLEVELRKLEDAAVAVNKHMNYMRQREAAMRDTNESTNARVFWFSLFSLVILISLGAWQIFFLKKYFESRKLI